MAFTDALLPEFDREMATTRKLLERLPEARLGWKPHQRSMSLARLATHLAELPSWSLHIIDQDEIDVKGGYINEDLNTLVLRDTPEALAVARDGGMRNAFTFLDWTTYFETMPADKIDLALQLESDRMINSDFDEKEFASERTVVISEREGNENEPMFLLGEAFKRENLVADNLPIVGVNAKDSSRARSFSLLHEVAHLVLGHGDVDRSTRFWLSDDQEETFCNEVAGNVLVPEDALAPLTVLQRGEILAEGDYASVSRNPEVIQAYLGTSHA